MPKALALRPRLRHEGQEMEGDNGVVPGTTIQDLRHNITIEPGEILSDRKVEECMAEIHQLSLETLVALNKVVHLDEYSWPALRDCDYWYKNLYGLLRDAMGLEEDECLDEAFRRLRVDLTDIGLYVRMIIAAEVTDQVFVSTFPRVPVINRAWASKAFRSLVKGAGSDEQDKIADQALLAWRDDSSVKKQILQNAKTFAEDTIETLSPLCSNHKLREFDEASDRLKQRTLMKHCGSHFEGIYLVAMTLRNEMNVKRCEYEFFWPLVGDALDRKTMDVEVMHQRKECAVEKKPSASCVKMTLLPGVRRVGEDSGRNYSFPSSGKEGMFLEKIIVRALVCLRSGED